MDSELISDKLKNELQLISKATPTKVTFSVH